MILPNTSSTCYNGHATKSSRSIVKGFILSYFLSTVFYWKNDWIHLILFPFSFRVFPLLILIDLILLFVHIVDCASESQSYPLRQTERRPFPSVFLPFCLSSRPLVGSSVIVFWFIFPLFRSVKGSRYVRVLVFSTECVLYTLLCYWPFFA